ncbi:type VI secretion system contractile sheath small subunit [Fluviispira vulneris]|uniref:type VI secretion system contractile sheath small subunit n=1 Tax=Fluviispira vulneris TaxID=2763012 RepID=UPI001648C621|nr:type VI secretion system contractile sheath small subunit [Fluviispira vulneris]
MSNNSIQHKLTKVRPPRVQITYDLQAEGNVKAKDIPFVVGVMANFSGHKNKKPQKLKNAQFLPIDKDCFNTTMQKVAPELTFKVENTIKKDGSSLNVKLKMNSMADFSPGKIAENHPELNKLLEIRKKLIDLQAKADSSETLEEVLNKLIQNPEALMKIAAPKKTDDDIVKN